MQTPHDNPMIELVDHWGAHFGYFDGKIHFSVVDRNSFATPDCTLTAHAPLWGTQEGKESVLPVAQVRQRLARALKVGRAVRHDMCLALHPDGDALCLFIRIKARLAFLPLTLRTVSHRHDFEALPGLRSGVMTLD